MQVSRSWLLFVALLGLGGVALAQPMAVPPDIPLEPPAPFAPDAAPGFADPDAPPSLPERGPRPARRGDALVPMGEAAPADAPPAKECFRVSLNDGSQILGTFAPDMPLTVKSKFGNLEVNIQGIGRIDPAFAEEDKFTVTLANGDRLTGKLDLTGVKLKTILGELPLDTDSLYGLEAGKLFEQSGPITRRSLDGRSVVTISRKYVRFQPNIQDPNTPYPSYPAAPTYSPYSPTPTPTSTPRASRPFRAPTTTYVVPPTFAPGPPGPTSGFGPADGFDDPASPHE